MAAKMEQIITEFFAKTLHIILESRCPCSSSSSIDFKPRDKWFNLSLRDCTTALDNIDIWRHSNLQNLVIDVVLVSNSESDEFGFKGKSENIIERWVVHYETRKNSRDRDSDSGWSSSKRLSSSSTSHQLWYKKCILLLRSLYLTLRLLPAYKLFRCLNSSSQMFTFGLTHRVSSFVEPFTHREEVDMQRIAFKPVDTSCGRLCISVLYRTVVSDVSSETSTLMSPRFIPDYVGSPMADPLKRLPSLPMPPQSSPPFGRRHSWSYDLTTASSPAYSEPRASLSKPFSTRPPPTTLPCHLPQVPYQNKSFDEYSFSPYSSPSPPTHVPRSHLSKALLRSDSAPVNIPASRLGDAPLLSNKQVLPPSPPHKASRLYGSRLERSSTLLQTGSTIEKLFSLGKDEIGRLSGAKITSNSSPPKSFSRSSSRLSFEDNFDDSEFSGPFVVDDDDITYPGSRGCSFEQRDEGGGVRKTQDAAAAVGALVHMLKKAPPLSQHVCETKITPFNNSQVVSEAAASGVEVTSTIRTTTADALEQLQGYKEIKNLLLNQSRTQA